MKAIVIDGVSLKVVNEMCGDRWGSLKVVNEMCNDRWGKSQSCQ